MEPVIPAGLRQILAAAGEKNASDVHLVPGSPPVVRVDGRLFPLLSAGLLTSEEIRTICREILPPARFDALETENQEIDAAFTAGDLGRFRINVHRQQGRIGLAIRCLQREPPEVDELGLPPVVRDLALRESGLILVTGPTGSGKSTTLASMIREVNGQQMKHIVTIEDPIEYVHEPRKCIITQREIGEDTRGFAPALRSALRQDPDVILVGEMRDLETIATALTAAETGHLVLSTLHTVNCVETINRIVDVFPTHQQHQIRLQLSSTLAGVVSQRLLPRSGAPGRVVATEVLIPTPAIRHLIREGKTHQIQTALQTGAKHRMHTMDASLLALFQQGAIDRETRERNATETDNSLPLPPR